MPDLQTSSKRDASGQALKQYGDQAKISECI